MTQEDKELLLKDLCARLPYGVIIQEYNEEYGYADNALNTIGIGYFSIHEACIEGTWINHIENVRPYFRPMSSMTKEERKDFVYTVGVSGKANIIGDLMLDYKRDYIRISETTRTIDWLNAHHFDYRGLIDKGLALSTDEFNPYKDKD